MSLVFTMPGKLGDALHQWPVVYWYCKNHNVKATLWLDENTLKPLKPLFEAQPCIEAVELKPGITSWHMGGQPWDFGLSMNDHIEHEIYHLGMRAFPTRQITLETLQQVPLNIERPDHVRTITTGLVDPGKSKTRRCLLHGNFTTHASGVPGFWRFLADRKSELLSLFDSVGFVGTPAEVKRAQEVHPDLTGFDDGGDFLELARYMETAQLVIGCGSAIVVLASLLGIPAIRVHDPIGEYPKVIWSNLGDNQINDTELELRTSWPGFRDKWLAGQEVQT